MQIYLSRYISGWGSSLHDFSVYTQLRGTSDYEYVCGLRSAYMPLMDRYTPLTIVRPVTKKGMERVYLSADMFPHLPFRSLRELEHDYRRGYYTKEVYERNKELFWKMSEYGLPLPYNIYFTRDGFPGPAIPFQVHPSTPTLITFVHRIFDELENDCKNTLRNVLRRVLTLYLDTILRRTRIVGYVPKFLLDHPRMLMNIFLLHATFLPFEISRRYDTVGRPLEVGFARAWVRGAPFLSSDSLDYYYRVNYLLHSVNIIEEDPDLPGMFSADPYGPNAKMWIISNIANNVRLHPKHPDRTSPFAATLTYLLDNDATIRDMLFVAYRDELKGISPDNTFSFYSALLLDAKNETHVKQVIEEKDLRVVSEETTLRYDSFRLRLAQLLLNQTFPYLYLKSDLDRLTDAYSKYDSLLPPSNTKKLLFEMNEYVDDSLINLLDKPSKKELLEPVS